jgi:hypothetical protein
MKLRLLGAKQTGKIVAADADALIASYGDGGYEEARSRARQERLGRELTGNRPAGHWQKVRLEIARRAKKEIGLDTASRYPGASG